MRELLKTNDTVLLSYARSVLADAKIAVIVADEFTSAIEGSVGILPRRLLVPEGTWLAARQALGEAGLVDELADEARP